MAKTAKFGLEHFPVISLLGPRQVGKTTLAREIAANRDALYLDLERPSDIQKLNEAELYLEANAHRLVILDEVQRKADLFPLLRSLVDANRKPGRFLLLGSSSPDLRHQSSESLAGRIQELELTPFLLEEMTHPTQAWPSLWERGGYPLSYLAPNAEISLQWRTAFIATHLERDIPNLGIRVPHSTLFRFWQLLAHLHGQIWNASTVANSMQVGVQAINHYLDILESTFMLRRLPPFSPNLKKRLVKSPKIYFRDTGLLHALLGIASHENLLSHPIQGSSWEGWSMEQVLGAMPNTWRPSFYRTQAGAEMDLVLERPGKAPWTVEFKYSAAPKVTKGFWHALEDIQPEKAFVVAPVQEAYPLSPKVTVVPIWQFKNFLD